MISSTASFSWCYCSDTLLGVCLQQSLIFSRLMRIHTCGGSLFHVIILGKSTFLLQGQCPVTLLYAPSFSYSQSLFKVVPEFYVYQDSTKSLILTFFLQIAYLEELLHKGPCVGYPLSAAIFLVLLVESQMRPQIHK